MEDLAALYPLNSIIKVKNTEFTLKPFGIGQFPRVFKAINRLKLTELKSLEGNVSSELNLKNTTLVNLILEHFDVFLEVGCIAINKDISYFDDMLPDEGLELLLAIIKVNFDFFVKRVLPLITEKLAILEEVK